MTKNLSEKGSDPLQRGKIQNEIEALPKGQTPFRIGSTGNRSRTTRRCLNRRGATAVELAIILPTTLLVLIGLCVAELGAFRYQQVAALAHESARWASVHGPEYATQSGETIASSEEILARVIKPKAIGLDLNKLTCQVDWNAEKNLVTVKIQYTWTPEAFFVSRKFSCTAVALATY